MLSSHSDRQVIKIYGVGLTSLVLVVCMMASLFYQTISQTIAQLEQQKKSLLAEKSQDSHAQQNKNLARTYGSDTLLKQKILYWVNQSQVQLVDMRFGTTITVSVIGSFAQNMSLLIELANTHVLFDVNAVDLVSVKNGIELRLGLAQESL